VILSQQGESHSESKVVAARAGVRGTHAGNTSEVGRFSIFRTENKGKINKRLYVRLV